MPIPKVLVSDVEKQLKHWAVVPAGNQFYAITTDGLAVWGEVKEEGPWQVKWASTKPSGVAWVNEIIEFIHTPL